MASTSTLPPAGAKPLNTNTKKPAVEQEQINTVVNHRDYPAPLSVINPEKNYYDAVVIGAGPAGLMVSSSLARLGGGAHDVLTVDLRTAPTEAGRADGIQPRTIEVLKNMQPLGDDLMARSSASYERTFWNPTADGKGIERSQRTQSVPFHLDIEDNCTLGLQQGLIEQAFLRDMEAHEARVVRPWSFKAFEISRDKRDEEYPVFVTLQHAKEQKTRTVRAKYLVGCDGGRSSVRHFLEAQYDFEMKGDWVDTLWGAIDAVVRSDFPDLRKIAAIHSKHHGSMYIFPRENTTTGKPIVRLYTQVNVKDGQKNSYTTPAHMSRESVQAKDVMDAVKRIIAPYTLDFEEIEWWTAYPIGQRLVSSYSLENRVFLAGDACHTHSPKAGQGMNTALMDAHNLSWKMHLVLAGLAKPDILSTYHTERWKIGKKLIDFDREYAALFSGEIPAGQPELAKLSEAELAKHFAAVQRRNADFTTGIGVTYDDAPLSVNLSPLKSSPNTKIIPGHRLLPASVTRSSNSQPVRLVHEVQFVSPGAFRIYVFAGGPVRSPEGKASNAKRTNETLLKLSKYLTSNPKSFVQRYRPDAVKRTGKKPIERVTPAGMNTGIYGFEDSNPFFNILTVIRDSRFGFSLEDLKDFGGLNSMVYADDQEIGGEPIGNGAAESNIGGAHRKYGLENGGIIVCRPDGYVGTVVPLDEAGWRSLESYFDSILVPSSKATQAKL